MQARPLNAYNQSSKRIHQTIDYSFSNQIGIPTKVYNSSVEEKMSHEEIKSFLKQTKLFGFVWKNIRNMIQKKGEVVSKKHKL